jgi:hypothetical protein
MSFKPANANAPRGNGGVQEFINVEPKGGSRPARVSLIADMGIQEREDFKDQKTGEMKPQKPCHQIAMALDLVNDVVDYGGEIGKQPYRLFLNQMFMGDFKGINFQAVPPTDPDGKIIQGKPWGLHPASPVTKLCNALDRKDVITSMEIDQLLDLPVMANVEVKKTPAKNGKVNDKGEPIVYTNVNYKGASPIPMIPNEDGDEAPMKVKALQSPAKCITFDNATKEDIKILRKGIIQKIKLAQNYAGSQIQKAIEAYEAENGVVEAAKPVEASKPAQAVSKPKTPVKPEDQDDDDIPF